MRPSLDHPLNQTNLRKCWTFWICIIQGMLCGRCADSYTRSILAHMHAQQRGHLRCASRISPSPTHWHANYVFGCQAQSRLVWSSHPYDMVYSRAFLRISTLFGYNFVWRIVSFVRSVHKVERFSSRCWPWQASKSIRHQIFVKSTHCYSFIVALISCINKQTNKQQWTIKSGRS